MSSFMLLMHALKINKVAEDYTKENKIVDKQ